MNLYQITAKTRKRVEGKIETVTVETVLRFPSKIEEVTNRMWCDFHALRDAQPKWFLQFEELAPEMRLGEMASWDSAKWCDFYVVIATLLTAFGGVVSTSSDSDATPPTIDQIMKLGGSGAIDGGNSLIAIYTEIVAMVLSYVPGNFDDTFTHKGQQFAINKPLIDRWGNQWFGQQLNVGDAIEALQVEHVLNQKTSSGEYAVTDRRFHRDAALLAILMQKVLPNGELEKPPINSEMRKEFMERRIKFFEDAPVTLALSAAFFLRSSNNAFIATLTSVFASRVVEGQSQEQA